LWDWNITTGQLNWSPELYTLFGLDPATSAATFDVWWMLLHPDDKQAAESNVNEAIACRTQLNNEYRIITSSGEVRWISSIGKTCYDDNGTAIGMSGICLEITSRKLAVEALVRSESELKAIYENSPIMMCLLDTERKIQYSNPAFAIFTGTPEKELKGLTACGVFHCVNAEDDPRGCGYGRNCLNCSLLRSIEDTFQTGTTHHNKEHTITLVRDGEQRKYTLLESATVINPGDHARLLIYLHDITEHKRLIDERIALEQQFQQTQKLESLGVLAGGIAHDFNNILAIIMGYCSLTKMDYEKAESTIPHIEKAAERAAALCRQMLAYAGKAQSIMTQVNVTALVDEMVTMLKSTTSQNVAIIPDLAAALPPLKGDASQLCQIVMNLIINASEAIGEAQGVIRISLTKITITAGQQEMDYFGVTIPVGGYICLKISDNGCGMDEETKRRIFEPFYSTKFSGRGLGMSATLGIITAHKGALQLSTVLGDGSTFTIYLPVQNSDITIEESLQQVKSAPWKGNGMILLVEDEEQVMLIVKTMLEALGFTIIEACNGREALERYRENAAEITLVVTDMGMPVMDGYELFRELKSMNPKLPIIITSGYGDTVITSRIPRNEIAGLVSKPYRFDRLRDVLKSVVTDR
jgi:PAS domain S-box-containing protein